MIFLTVGSQMPFDRLVQAVDAWAAARGDAPEVVAQIGDSTLRPQHLRHRRSMPPAEFQATCAAARFLVGHAGMGTVLTALELGKPLLLLPRRGELQETRNDHQLATARWLQGRQGIHIAWDVHELVPLLDSLMGADRLPPPSATAPDARLIGAIRGFIQRT